ncbi:MAG TPA: 23S rRNA (guanosine(2251)-2'-O)-methyltransferase RlmB [Thermoanaerobaculia bacterium]|jgi:23S rRNA (guanosine2251-2'-O)-methyltransferase|nr:23S rRNA (guanosine(2251)-2'-O)-methyltransferase RlmB [Thermoanaerobaculia bacterium]
MIVSRFHPVEEAVKARPREIEWVLFDSERHDRRVSELRRLCRENGVSVRDGLRRTLDQLAGPAHQGVVARLAVREYLDETEAVSGTRGERLLLVLDEVQDPHNLGAVIRVADAIGAMVVVHERGSAPLSETVARSSAGAVERVPIVRAKNLRRFLDHLKNEGFRVIGLDPEGRDYFELDLTGDLALVLGAEGKGMRRLVREGCDELGRLPMRGTVASLNVSTAAAAAGYEAVRQRGRGGKKGS